jgi:hypothetical protein
MPYGKGTYGKKKGRPPKKNSKKNTKPKRGKRRSAKEIMFQKYNVHPGKKKVAKKKKK